ncbi:MAG: reverse transcriptase domain-containing protein [Nanoarchaeota archaeon]
MEKVLSYEYLYSMGNLTLAWRKARKGKTKKQYVIEFEKHIEKNLLELHYELKNKTYFPKQLKTFVLRDPKTRVISKSDFRDRIVHHALINVIGPKFEKSFFYDSCANQTGKGTFFTLKRFDKFQRKVTKSYSQHSFCLKADIKHYFREVDTGILLLMIKRKIVGEDVIELIKKILSNIAASGGGELGYTQKGMPLGNLTSQFFANVYLSELDYFVKHILKAKYYIRYVDDFVILHKSRKQLETWTNQIEEFLADKLKIQLHPQKSRISSISRGIDFVGFRNFYHHKLLRKRNIMGMKQKINLFEKGCIKFQSLAESYQGWQAYARWADTYKIRGRIKQRIVKALWEKV